MSIECPILLQSNLDPDKLAIRVSGGLITYSRFHQDICRFQSGLKKKNILTSDVLIISSDFDYHYLCLFFACLREGVIVFPLNHSWKNNYITHLLDSVFSHDSSQFKFVFVSNTLSELFTLTRSELYDYSYQVQEIEQVDKLDSIFSFKYDLDQPATFLFTSGSCGTPKIATHYFKHHYENAVFSNMILNFMPGDTWLHTLPMYHVSGISICFRVFFGGGTLSLELEDLHNFDSTLKFTHISLVPTLLNRFKSVFSDSNWTNKNSIKSILVGGAQCPRSLLDYSIQYQLPVYLTYGLTENSSQVAVRKLSSQDRFFSLENTAVSISEHGSLLIKGSSLFHGYLMNGKYKLDLDQNGYFDTKDKVAFDGDGFLIQGRIDNMFISGGENIQPEEIEQAILTSGSVQEAYVVGVSDLKFGVVPALFVHMDTFSEVFVLNYLRDRLPNYKLPKYIFDLYAIKLKNTSFKINRSDLSLIAQKNLDT